MLNHIHALFNLALFIMLAMATTACKPRNTLSTLPMSTYYYIDALGNRYILTVDSLRFEPMKPHLSSSGMADGGDPKVVSMGAAGFESLQARFDAALADKAHHLDQRLMGCGTVTIETDGKDKTAFLQSNAESRTQLESLLKQSLK